MSVPASTNKVQYILTSEALALSIPFYFIENGHVRVIRTRNYIETPLTSGFSLNGAGVASGGTLTLDGSQTLIGDRITIKRVVPLTQLIRYVANDRFPASTHERGLDESAMRAQQAQETADRALLYGEGEVIGTGNRIPSVSTRRAKLIGFDVNGNVDMSILADDIRTLIIANPVDELTDVTDYGSIEDAVTSTADYGSID